MKAALHCDNSPGSEVTEKEPAMMGFNGTQGKVGNIVIYNALSPFNTISQVGQTGSENDSHLRHLFFSFLEDLHSFQYSFSFFTHVSSRYLKEHPLYNVCRMEGIRVI
jgi:hypothetical protein